MKNHLLLDEYPLVVSPKLATLIGLNEAIFIQQLNYWLHKDGKEREGRKWIYKSIKEWQTEDFPFWSDSTIKRVISSLKNRELIDLSNYNKAGFDKTKWYTINYEKLQSVTYGEGQNDLTCGSDWSNAVGQLDQTNTRDYTETTTENNNNMITRGQTPPKNDAKSLEENFKKLWELYPRKEGRSKAFTAYKKAIKDGVTNKEIQDGIVRYKHKLQHERTEQKYIAQGGTWFHNRRWEDDYGMVVVSHKQTAPPPKEQEEELSEEEARMLLEGLTEGVNDNANNGTSDEST